MLLPISYADCENILVERAEWKEIAPFEADVEQLVRAAAVMFATLHLRKPARWRFSAGYGLNTVRIMKRHVTQATESPRAARPTPSTCFGYRTLSTRNLRPIRFDTRKRMLKSPHRWRAEVHLALGAGLLKSVYQRVEKGGLSPFSPVPVFPVPPVQRALGLPESGDR
jgi:hypothetical protein